MCDVNTFVARLPHSAGEQKGAGGGQPAGDAARPPRKGSQQSPVFVRMADFSRAHLVGGFAARAGNCFHACEGRGQGAGKSDGATSPLPASWAAGTEGLTAGCQRVPGCGVIALSPGALVQG